MKTISLYPALVRWKDNGKLFRTNIGYSYGYVEVPNDIEDTVFWWSDDTPYVGMDLDEATLVEFIGEPETITLGGER